MKRAWPAILPLEGPLTWPVSSTQHGTTRTGHNDKPGIAVFLRGSVLLARTSTVEEETGSPDYDTGKHIVVI